MFKFSHVKLIFISGTIWLAVGIFLLQMGVSLLMQAVKGSYPLINFLGSFLHGSSEAAVIILALSLYVGFLKGKFVFHKSATKNVARICSLPAPAAIYKIYNAKYYLLLSLMVLLGMSIKYFGLPLDVRGAIDVAVGAALINGSVSYYRQGLSLSRAF